MKIISFIVVMIFLFFPSLVFSDVEQVLIRIRDLLLQNKKVVIVFVDMYEDRFSSNFSYADRSEIAMGNQRRLLSELSDNKNVYFTCYSTEKPGKFFSSNASSVRTEVIRSQKRLYYDQFIHNFSSDVKATDENDEEAFVNFVSYDEFIQLKKNEKTDFINNMEEHLKESGINDVVIGGFNEHGEVQSVAKALVRENFNVIADGGMMVEPEFSVEGVNPINVWGNLQYKMQGTSDGILEYIADREVTCGR